jgi:uncharacterized protein YjbJ (UPF0337 family)
MDGNPLAAGVIAFGTGWLIGSLLPASQAEQTLAGQASDVVRDHAQPVTQRIAEEVKENLREPAQQAAESVKDTVSDAASTVSQETRAATQDVAGRAKEAMGEVQAHSG